MQKLVIKCKTFLKQIIVLCYSSLIEKISTLHKGVSLCTLIALTKFLQNGTLLVYIRKKKRLQLIVDDCNV